MPLPLPTPGTHKPIVLPQPGLTNVIQWRQDTAAMQSSQITAGLTLGSDAITAASVTTTPGLGSITLGSDTLVAAGTLKTPSTAAFALASDAVASHVITTTPGLGAVALLGDVVFASFRPLPFAHPTLTLAADVVRALSNSHPVTTADPALVLAGDLVHAAGSAAPSSVAAAALVLYGDLVIVPATAHPITTATTGTTGLGIHLADDGILALDGRSWGTLHHILHPDLINAAASVVMPASVGSTALTLASDVVRADPEAFPPVTATVALVLAGDLVNAQTVAFRTAYADAFAATEGV